ncbi:MAG TPA: hypothetical protein VKD66_13585 [Streptosporangiaceae bacterium]|nr:hypothetical protein [Streptosporangiaceae bacterium]
MKTLSGKAAVPDDSPYTTGGIGLLGTRPSAELMSDIDTLLLVGTNFPYTKHLPPPGKVRVAQVEADPAGRPDAHRAAGGRRQQADPPGPAAPAQAAERYLVPEQVPEGNGQVAAEHGQHGQRRPRPHRPAVRRRPDRRARDR